MTIDPADQAWLSEQVEALTFGAILKAHRLCEGWTQAEAAQKLGVTKQMLSAYESGKRRPAPKKAYEIAQALGFSLKLAVLHVLKEELQAAGLSMAIELKASA